MQIRVLRMIKPILDLLLDRTIIMGQQTRPTTANPSVRPQQGASGSTGNRRVCTAAVGSKQERVPRLKLALVELQDPGIAKVMK